MSLTHLEKSIASSERKIFLKRWLRHPLQLGTMAPISYALARSAAQLVSAPETAQVLEVGSGTGRLSRQVLSVGVLPRHLHLVEMDGEFCHFLRKTLPGDTQIIEGDATYVAQAHLPHMKKEMDVIYSVIPLTYLSVAVRHQIVSSCLELLKPTGTMYHVCYSPVNPFRDSSSIRAQRIKSLWVNCPPGFIWEITHV